MKKTLILTLAALFFIGCSTKEVTIGATAKPDYISQKITSVKINPVKNDNISLTKYLTWKIRYVNNYYPDYLNISPEYKYIISGFMQNSSYTEKYYKNVLIRYKKPRCRYLLYSCKNINGSIFCKDSKPLTVYDKEYKKISKNIYKKPPYILYKNRIYKTVHICRPKFKTVMCYKNRIDLKVKFVIKNKKGNIIYSNPYAYTKTDDPCANIYYYNGINIYKPYISYKEELNKGKKEIVDSFINDIAPHYIYYNAVIFDDTDVNMKSADETLFNNAISSLTKSVNLYSVKTSLQSLSLQYPKSCVLKYDLAVTYEKMSNFKKAKKLFIQILKHCKNSDVLQNADIQLNEIKNLM